MINKIYTIGVYGFSEEEFFQRLKEAKIDTFVDIRMRRGMRGSKYAFANSAYLQAKLEEIGINYLHYLKLAPTQEIRDLQMAHDKEKGVSGHERKNLGEAYVNSYRDRILNSFEITDLLNALGEGASSVVLFCVEKEPEACHRSLAAKYLAQKIGLEIINL